MIFEAKLAQKRFLIIDKTSKPDFDKHHLVTFCLISHFLLQI